MFFCAGEKAGALRRVGATNPCGGGRGIPLVVSPINNAPVADDDTYAVDEDGALDVPAPGVLEGDTDAENGTLTAVLVDGPANDESFTLNPDGSFSYQPNADFNGTDTFTYKANDGKKSGNTATVTITVNPINDPPAYTDAASNTSQTIDEGSGLAGLRATDADGDNLTFELTGGSLPPGITLDGDGGFAGYRGQQGRGRLRGEHQGLRRQRRVRNDGVESHGERGERSPGGPRRQRQH